MQDRQETQTTRLAVIDLIFDSREKYTPLEWGVAHLYFRCGMTQKEIAEVFHCKQPTVAYYLKQIRRKALS